MHAPHCLWPLAAELGEGPVWDAARGWLWFVDILGRRIHRCDAGGAARQSWPAPDMVGFALPLANNGRAGALDFVVGLPGSLQRFDAATGHFQPLLALEQQLPGNRLNDGQVDAMGRLWFGSMDVAQREPTGALYSVAADGRAQQHDGGYVVTNGPATSPDGRVLYHTDTLERVVYAFDLSPEGRLSGKRELLRIEGGWPDGTTVDAEGHLWIALFGGGRVERWTPAGRRVATVPLPCSNATKLAFGGTDLRTAFVTTARYGVAAEQAAQQPLAGGVFAFDVDAPGLPQHAVSVGFDGGASGS